RTGRAAPAQLAARGGAALLVSGPGARHFPPSAAKQRPSVRHEPALAASAANWRPRSQSSPRDKNKRLGASRRSPPSTHPLDPWGKIAISGLGGVPEPDPDVLNEWRQFGNATNDHLTQ